LQTKKLVEELPSTLGENLPKEQAEEWAKKLKEAGAEVELE